MCVYIWPECAVCVSVMFDNQFQAYTSQIWPDKEAFLILVNLN